MYSSLMGAFSDSSQRKFWVSLSINLSPPFLLLGLVLQGVQEKFSLEKEAILTRGCDAQNSQVAQLLPKLLPTEWSECRELWEGSQSQVPGHLGQGNPNASQKGTAFVGRFHLPEYYEPFQAAVQLRLAQPNSQTASLPSRRVCGPGDSLEGSWIHCCDQSPGPGGLDAPEGT